MTRDDEYQISVSLGQAINLATQVMTTERIGDTSPVFVRDNEIWTGNEQRLNELTDFFFNYIRQKRKKVFAEFENPDHFEETKKKVASGIKLTVPDWEKLTPEQQEYFQELKRKKGRENYAERKTKPNREKCPTCSVYRYVGEPCPACDTEVVGDRYNQREVEPSELRGGDGDAS